MCERSDKSKDLEADQLNLYFLACQIQCCRHRICFTRGYPESRKSEVLGMLFALCGNGCQTTRQAAPAHVGECCMVPRCTKTSKLPDTAIQYICTNIYVEREGERDLYVCFVNLKCFRRIPMCSYCLYKDALQDQKPRKGRFPRPRDVLLCQIKNLWQCLRAPKVRKQKTKKRRRPTNRARRRGNINT
jgi:hypothetical protein